MHFSTSLLLLSGASAVLAGSFAAPAAPVAHLAHRQASREQVVRRQQHKGMMKYKRQAQASAVVNQCGAPSRFNLVLSDINARDDQDNQAALNALNGQYVIPDPDLVLTSTQSVQDASAFAVRGADCTFQAFEGTAFLNIESSSVTAESPYVQLVFSTPEQNVGFEADPVSCQISSSVLTCSAQAGEFALDTLLACTINDYTFMAITTSEFQEAGGLANCSPVTLMSFAA